MHALKRCLPGRIDRAVDKRYEVEVADAGNVVAHRQRSRHKQISDPPEGCQPATELFDDWERGRHELQFRKLLRLARIFANRPSRPRKRRLLTCAVGWLGVDPSRCARARTKAVMRRSAGISLSLPSGAKCPTRGVLLDATGRLRRATGTGRWRLLGGGGSGGRLLRTRPA